jgi:hypothetical protein
VRVRSALARVALPVVAVLVIATLTCVPVLTAPASAADGTTFSVTMVGQPGHFVLNGESRVWRDGAGTIFMDADADSVYLQMNGGTSGEGFEADFEAPEGANLTVGEYEHAVRSISSGVRPGLDISGDGRGCNQSTGRFSVLDIDLAQERFWVVFEFHCDGTVPAIFGEIKVGMPDSDSDLLVTPDLIRWPTMYPEAMSSTVPVTVANTGSSPMTITSATTSSADFSVTQNTCTSLAPAASCVIEVLFHAQAPGPRTGVLSIGGSFGSGVHTVALRGDGAVGHNTWSIRGEPLEVVTQGGVYEYRVGDPWGFDGDANIVRGYAENDHHDWTLIIKADPADRLEAGRTYTATSYYNDGLGGARIRLWGPGFCTASGSFTIHEITFDESGGLASLLLDLRQKCDEGTKWAYSTVAWRATRASAPPPPVLDMTLSRTSVGYGDTVTVDAALSRDSAIRTLSVFKTEAGSMPVLVTKADVDSAGRLSVPVVVSRRTTFTVLFDGRGREPDRSATATVRVAAEVAQKMLGQPRKSGRYHLYRSSGTARVRATVRPSHGGDCLRFRAEFRLAGRWAAPSVLKCVVLRRQSRANVAIPGSPSLVGVPIRVRAEWRGDEENDAKIGSWLYLKFVR